MRQALIQSVEEVGRRAERLGQQAAARVGRQRRAPRAEVAVRPVAETESAPRDAPPPGRTGFRASRGRLRRGLPRGCRWRRARWSIFNVAKPGDGSMCGTPFQAIPYSFIFRYSVVRPMPQQPGRLGRVRPWLRPAPRRSPAVALSGMEMTGDGGAWRNSLFRIVIHRDREALAIRLMPAGTAAPKGGRPSAVAFGIHGRHAVDAVLQFAHVARPIVGHQACPSRLAADRTTAVPATLPWSRKCSTSSGISSFRSRKGGRCMVNTLSR